MDTPLWGKQTELARSNFPIANRPLDVRVARALATIKRHAAAVNVALGVGDIDDELAGAIAEAAERVERGELDDQFPVDIFQTGSGTSTNMNVNEVLATLVEAALDDRVPHPNDHINASQSSNDTVPTAIRLAVARLLADEVHPAVDALAASFRELAERFRHVVKAGRTHLMDATPVTLGQEAAAWAGLLERALVRSQADLVALGELPLGGTAVGTGLNAPEGFAEQVVARIAAETGLPLEVADDPMVHMGGQGAAGRGLGRVAWHRHRARRRSPTTSASWLAGHRAGWPSCCSPNSRRDRRSCPARSTRCSASRSTRWPPGCSATTPRWPTPRRRGSSS